MSARSIGIQLCVSRPRVKVVSFVVSHVVEKKLEIAVTVFR